MSDKTRATGPAASGGPKVPTGRARAWFGPLAAGIAVVAGGFAYRLMAGAIAAEMSATVQLPQALSTLPMVIGAWHGEDLPVSEGVQRIAQNDDFVNRRYADSTTGRHVNLYIGYTARPRTMLRHRPTVCYPSAGWSFLGTTPTELDAAGQKLPVLIHTFLKTGVNETRAVVLNYYVLNGRPTADESSFWGLKYRSPNLGRDASRYVAQVQIMVPVVGDPEAFERVAKEFACETAPQILRLLPGTDSPGRP